MNDIIMFYTSKAGLKSGGIQKLKKTGIVAVQVEDPKEISWPRPEQAEWLSLHDNLAVIMLRALTRAPSGDVEFGKVMAATLRRQAGITPEGNMLAAVPDKKKTA